MPVPAGKKNWRSSGSSSATTAGIAAHTRPSHTSRRTISSPRFHRRIDLQGKGGEAPHDGGIPLVRPPLRKVVLLHQGRGLFAGRAGPAGGRARHADGGPDRPGWPVRGPPV